MFVNVLGQNASVQLAADIKAGILAPAMLFSGPPSSGKGTAALELARVISCEKVEAAWNCDCSACTRHRLLVHPDLLCLGSRPFYAEIAAAAGALQRDSSGSAATRLLFIRAVRKLLARFHPVLWEDEPKAAKVAPLVLSLDEELSEIEYFFSRSSDSGDNSGENVSGEANAAKAAEKKAALSKLIEAVLKNSQKLEAEGIADSIPIGQLRRAASWSNLAPIGKGKLLVIENAGRMQDEARNSLLKILEEPPQRLRLVLTTPRPGSLLPTILSRLRVYRFYAREAAVEEEVIRRVFKDSNKDLSISAYLDSFLPVSTEGLDTLAAFFTASVAYKAALLSKKIGRPLSNETLLLGTFSAPKAEAAGFGRPNPLMAAVVDVVLEKAEKFEIRSLFPRFLFSLLEQVRQSLNETASAPSPAYNEMWKKNTEWAETAVGVYNLKPAQVLEKLFADLSAELGQA